MSSGEIHQEVARATGESVRVIKQFGFSLLVPGASHDDEPDYIGPQVIDWDELEAERISLAIQA